ncbi:MAG: hypothetical protein GQ536_07240 [Candidatus Aminicenantes bacterium]|nr:hypothetical protein [Candidatus Aminicenantes bacterium]
MPKDKNSKKKAPLSIEDIENKLKDALARKEEEIEKEIEEKGKQVGKEEKKKEKKEEITEEIKEEVKEEIKEIDPVQKESGDEESRVNYMNLIAEYKRKREDLKSNIDEFLNKANQFQREFETITGQTLEELKKVSELSQKLEEFNQEADSKISSIKKKVEEKSETPAWIPESAEQEEVRVDLGQELAKVKKIKDVFGVEDEIEIVGEETAIGEETKEEVTPISGVTEETVGIREEERAGIDDVHFEMEKKDEDIEAPLSEKEMEEALEEKPPEAEEKMEGEVSLSEAMDETTRTIAAEEPKEVSEKEEFIVEEEISPLEAMDETIKIKAEDLMRGTLPKEEEVEKEEVKGEEEAAEGVSFQEAMDETRMTVDTEKPEEELEKEEFKIEEKISPLEAMDETIRIKAEDLLKGTLPKKEEVEKEEEKGEEEVAEGVSFQEATDETSDTITIEPPEEMQVTEEKEEAGIEESMEVYEPLKDYRKTDPPDDENGIIYYQNKGRIVLDSERLISTLSGHLEEGKKLYTKLSQTESPKDQFFVKQEIIRQQEDLREIFSRSSKMIEEKSGTLPECTIEIVNKDIIKEILEKLGTENWSNQDEFTFFEEYVKKIKDDLYSLITPRENYVKLIIDELGIE